MLVTALSFAQSETWISTGFEYGNFFEISSEASLYTGSPGITASIYKFWDQSNIGLFLHASYLFPTVQKLWTDEDIHYYRIEDAYYTRQFDFMFGLGYRHNIIDKLKLQAGLGINILETFSLFDDNVQIEMGKQLHFGYGGDIGLRYDINKYLYFNIGSKIAFDFLKYMVIRRHSATDSPSGKESKTWFFAEPFEINIKPYICIGFN
jgi:hypothetical protein